jgi:site-specific DNA recombinase
MTRVATYGRVSTGMQAEKGKSIAAQQAEMREFAAARGWEIVAEFIDPGFAGTDMNRPGLDAVLAAAEERTFDVLLVHELSRLSRRIFDTFRIFDQLGKFDVGFASVKEPNFDFSSPTGRLFLTILAALNQYYVDLLKMHTAKSKRERARRGLYNASITPYGYQHVGDNDTPPEIIPEEAKVVEKMYEQYATGLYSYREVAEWINEQGHRTRKGRRFSKDTVADMLRNPFYKGIVVYKQGEHAQDAGEEFEGQHEPIVSEDLWERCARMRDRRHTAPRTYQPQYRVYLLNSVVTCDVCGRKLRAQGAKSGDYYREVSGWRGFVDCPDAGRGVRAEQIDQQVGAVVRRLQLPEDWQKRLREMVDDGENGEVLASQRARLVAERRRLKEAWIRGDFEGEDEDIYEQALKRVQRELAELPSQSDLTAIEQAAEVIEELWEVWDEAAKEDRRDLLRLVLRDVKVDAAQGRVAAIEPYPVFIPLFREMAWLREVGFGVFHPVWPMERIRALDVMEVMAPLEKQPEPEVVPDWPLVVDLPEAVEGKRITPALSDWLKERKHTGEPLGPVVALRNRSAQPLKVGHRHWPDVTIEQVDDLGDLEDESVGFLWMPFLLQRWETKATLLEDVWRVVEPGGMWALTDVLPLSMEGHWLYRYFPEALDNDRGLTWDTYEMYNALQKAGFKVELKRRNVHQAVALGIAQEMARERARCPQLAFMPDTVYESGMERLKAAVEEKGKRHLEASEVCLVEVKAQRG